VAQTGHTLQWQAPVTGAGALIKDGAGTLVLTEDNSYAGGTQVLGGRLSVASNASLGATATGEASTNVTLNNGTLEVTGTDFASTDRSFTLGAGGAILDVVESG